MKLPIWSTISEAYVLVFKRLTDFVALAAVPILISIAGFAFLTFFFQPETPGFVAFFIISIIIFLTTGVPWIVFLVAWHRFVLIGRRDTHRSVEFHLGKREVKFFGYGVVLVLYVVILYVIFRTILFTLGIEDITTSWKLWLSQGITVILMLLLSVRFLFLFPAIAVGDDTGVKTAWKQSGGVAWQLFLALVLAALPFHLFDILIAALRAEETEGAIAPTQENQVVWELMLTSIRQLVMFLRSAVSVSVLALAYQHAVGGGDSGEAQITGAMTTRKTKWVLVCLAAAAVAYAVLQGGTWETYRAAGDKAYQQGNYPEAEKQWVAALKEAEGFGPQDPRLSASLNELGEVYRTQGKYADAEPLHKRALAIREKALGPEHPHVATSLNNLGLVYHAQGRYAEAEPLHQRSLAIKEKALGPEHPRVATSLNNLALVYRAQRRYAEAEPLYKRSLAIIEKVLGPEHRHVASSLENYAALLRATGRNDEAERMEARAKAIRAKHAR